MNVSLLSALVLSLSPPAVSRAQTASVDQGVDSVEVLNLDQVKVGDRLKISFTEQVIVLVGNSSQPPRAEDVGEIGVAPKGAKPSIAMPESYAVTAKVAAVDTAKHRVTLQDPDGKKKTIKLGKNVTNLDQLKVGEMIGTVITDSLVVQIVK